MAEKNQSKETVATTPSRFEFILTANGNIVCKRGFNIENFQERSLGSVNLAEAMTDCMNMIDADLKEKTNIYNWLSAPCVFKDKEEFDKWVEKHPTGIDAGTFVVFRDEEGVYSWTGEALRPYTKPYNRSEYCGDEPEESFVLKFAFLDSGEEVRSICWDGTKYPKFIRYNIDLSNSKNKYAEGDFFAPYECSLVNAFISGRKSLIPQIMRRLEYACNGVNLRYFSRLRYGDRRYELEVGKYFSTRRR